MFPPFRCWLFRSLLSLQFSNDSSCKFQAYLYDLSCNCNLLRSREKFSELKRLFSSHCEPSNSTCNLSDKKFGVDYIANPKKKVDPLTIKLLIENPQNQYNLVCNFLMEVCECNDTDKVITS